MGGRLVSCMLDRLAPRRPPCYAPMPAWLAERLPVCAALVSLQGWSPCCSFWSGKTISGAGRSRRSWPSSCLAWTASAPSTASLGRLRHWWSASRRRCRTAAALAAMLPLLAPAKPHHAGSLLPTLPLQRHLHVAAGGPHALPSAGWVGGGCWLVDQAKQVSHIPAPPAALAGVQGEMEAGRDCARAAPAAAGTCAGSALAPGGCRLVC